MVRKRSTGSGRSLPWRINRGQQEHRFRLLLIVVTAAVSLLVSGLLGYGLFQEYWLTPRRAVATVGQQAISLRILQQHTRYRRVQLLNEYFTYAELMQYVGAQRDQLQVRMDQIDEQLNEPLTLATQVLEQLVLAELVRMEAAKRSITVNDAEIEAAVNDYFGYEADLALPTLVPAGTIVPKSQDMSVSTPIPTPTPYTESAYQETYASHLATLNADTNMNDTDFRGLFEDRLLLRNLREVMASELKISEEEQVYARHILLPLNEFEIAQEVLRRALEGEDFDALAAEFSTDGTNSGNSGDLGWFSRGQMVTAFEKAAFSAEIGVIPELVVTQFGLHVVEILEKEKRAVPENVLAQRRQQVFDEWLSGRRSEENVEILYWWEALAPVEPTVQEFYARLRTGQ